MSKLPPNYVTAPTFDNPIRRTAAPSLAVVAEPAADATAPGAEMPAPVSEAAAPAVKASRKALKAKPARKRVKAAGDGQAEELYRTTLRIPQSVYLALESECHVRRLAGQKVSVAELLREITVDWASKAPRTR